MSTPPPNPRSRGRQRLSRWALVFISAGTAITLLWTAWTSKKRIDEASLLLIRGQVGTFLGSMRQIGRDRTAWRSDDKLKQFLAEQQGDGLRYIAFIEGDGRVVAHAGTPELSAPVPTTGDLTITRGTSRARAVFPPPPHPPHPPRGADDDDRAHRPTLVLELEPIVANRLEQDANRTLLLSGVVAGAFLLVALVLWKVLVQREREEERIERERRLAQLGEMSAVLAHEIRNPLTSLKGHAQLLAEQLEPGTKQRKKAERIVAEAKRIEDLGSTLLEFLRSGQVERTDARPLDLVKLAVEAVDASRVHVEAAGAPDAWSLDPLRIRQVLTNLLTNAVQASEGGDPVEVTLAREDNALVIAVRDHGPGIERGEEERIFEAFYTKRTRGVGLGLAVARRIVEMHGGTIKAQNHPDGGALFRIVIPA